MEINKLKLLTMKPINIGCCNVHHITVDGIDEATEEVYRQYLSILLFDKDQLDSENTFNSDITEFDITLMNAVHDKDFCENIISALEFFLKDKVNFINDNNLTFFYLGDINAINLLTEKDYTEFISTIDFDKVLSADIYFKIRDILRQLNCIEKNTKRKAGNKIAEDFINEMNALKEKYKNIVDKKKETVTIADLVSAITWRGNRSYDEVLGFTVYRLYDALGQINTLDNYTFMMNGIYAGTIDTKKEKSTIEKLNWIK